MTTESIRNDARRLIDALATHRRVIIAFSGGVDSSVVAAAAHRAPLESAVAVTAQSPSVPAWQIEIAAKVAAEIGIEHRVVSTHEGDLESYRRNDRDRCFFCKDTLYQTLGRLDDGGTGAKIVSGTNADDLGDYRPGIAAGNRRSVSAPLAELGIGKARVRELAEFFELSNHDLPASPCLASRVAYGTEVTPQRLRRIEAAESHLRALGFSSLRVRLHEGELARIEVERDQVPRLVESDRDGSITRKLLSLGFQYVTIDLEGFRSGNLNQALVTLQHPAAPAANTPSADAPE